MLSQQGLVVFVYVGDFYPGFYVYGVWDTWYYTKEGTKKLKSAIVGFLEDFSAIFVLKLSYPS